ncbi:MAG: hypothetical protein Q9167_007694 [Letrouitia subvulpina]
MRLYELYSSYILLDKSFPVDKQFAQLLTDTAWYLGERGGGEEIYDLLKVTEEICEKQVEDVRELLCEIYYARGAFASETNNVEIAYNSNTALLNLRLDISKTSQNDQRDPKVAHAYNQAANAHMDRRKINDAIGLYKQAIKIYQRIPGFPEVDTTICVANLATALCLTGKLQEARQILIVNHRAREHEYGEDDRTSFRYV